MKSNFDLLLILRLHDINEIELLDKTVNLELRI
jgi:hypothetical protein